nr:MAG TPA: hypothetical protein [Caudoviricetes sp.]
MLIGRSLPKWKASKSIYIDMMKDMVYTLVKAKESLPLGKPIGANDPL